MPSSDDLAADVRPKGHHGPVAAYIVLSHRDPMQVERLVAAIRGSSPRSYVVVAHDARRSPAPRALDERVHVWEHGLRTDWGSWELVEATLGAFRRARDLADPDMVVLISGSDYPVLDLEHWETAFLYSGGGWLGDASPLQYRPRWGRRYGEGQDDLTRYVYRWIRIPRTGLGARLPTPVERLRGRLRDGLFLRTEPLMTRRVVTRGRGTYVGVRRLRTPFSHTRPCCKGSQWVAMDRDLLGHLLAVASPESDIVRFYEGTIIPDESLIPTVLAWRRAPAGSRPVLYLGQEETDRSRYQPHLVAQRLAHSEVPFCRMVDDARVTAPVPRELMEALDARKAAGSAEP